MLRKAEDGYRCKRGSTEAKPMTKYDHIECETDTVKAVKALCAIKGISLREFITRVIQEDKEVKEFIRRLTSYMPSHLKNKF